MWFGARDRERLAAVDTRTTKLEATLPAVIETIQSHVKWCNKLQFAILSGIVAVLLKLLFPHMSIGEGL